MPNPTTGKMNFAVGPTNQPVFPLMSLFRSSMLSDGFSGMFTPAFMPNLNWATAGIDAKRLTNDNNRKNFLIVDNDVLLIEEALPIGYRQRRQSYLFQL